MSIHRRMTGYTVFWRALENSIYMASLASYSCMLPGQRECCLAMVEGYILPAACIMALGTFLAELSLMNIFRRVTGKAFRWRAFENAIYMTSLACNIHVQAC